MDSIIQKILYHINNNPHVRVHIYPQDNRSVIVHPGGSLDHFDITVDYNHLEDVIRTLNMNFSIEIRHKRVYLSSYSAYSGTLTIPSEIIFEF